MLISARAPKIGREATVEYNIGEDLNEAINLFGDAVVYSAFKQSAVIDVQAVIRRMLEAGKSEEEIQNYLSSYKLGVRTTSGGGRRDSYKAALEALLSASPEEREAKIAEIRAKLAARNQSEE